MTLSIPILLIPFLCFFVTSFKEEKILKGLGKTNLQYTVSHEPTHNDKSFPWALGVKIKLIPHVAPPLVNSLSKRNI